MTYRNRALLDLAHLAPCTADFAHHCSEYQGVEPAHSDAQIWGRGHGHKSHDHAHAALCHTAHMMLDTFEREVKQTEWTKAHVKTMTWYFENGFLVVNKRGRIAA
jgi:hypothetical protein